MKNKSTIEFCIEYENPIEIHEFTKSLNGFSDEYKKFINEKYGSIQPINAKLHIEKIKEGSILATLAEYSEFGIPFLLEINTIYEFGKNLKSILNYFGRSKNNVTKPEYDISDLQNLSSILNPGSNVGNNITINIKGNGNELVVYEGNSERTGVISNRMSKEIKELSSDIQSKIYKKQLFYFKQAKKGDSKAGNFGIIEALSPNKLRVVFENDEEHKQMIDGVRNPFNSQYLVDVEVQTAHGGVAKAYKILKLNEII